MWHVLQKWRVDRAFSGGQGAGAALAMRAHLAGCSVCRQRYHRWLVAESALPDGERRAEQRLWREIERVASARVATWPRRWVLALALVAATGVALVVLPRPDRFVARGPTSPSGVRPAVHLFRVAPGGGAEPVVDRIHAGDGLLFAYSNPGDGYSHLVVCAIDGRGQIYWYYPAYEKEGTDPQALPIEGHRTGIELHEVIRQPLPPGTIRLITLFLPRPMSISAIEDWLQAGYRAGHLPQGELSPPGPDIFQQSQLLQVLP